MDEAWEGAREHVVWPGLVRLAGEDDAFTLYNPGHGTSLDVQPESAELVDEILAGFAEPTRPDTFLGEHDHVPPELLVLMARSFMLVEPCELAFLEHGFLKPTPNPVGDAWSWSDVPDVARPGTWVTLGVPVDYAAGGAGGARLGPAEIRKVVNGSLLTGRGEIVDYEFGRLYPEAAPLLADLGDVEPDGARMDHVGARLRKAVDELLAHGMRPLVLGGDHSLTHHVLASLIARGEPFGILHFDAHADMGPSRTVSHANVFSQALDSPVVTSIVQIGLRGIERTTPFARRTRCPKRTVVTAREALAGRARAVLDGLSRAYPYYLTFDIDCIDGAVARETGAPLFAGLGVGLATELVDHIARTFRLVGADFVEVSGPPSVVNASATIAANLLARCVLGEADFEPLDPHDVHVL